MLTDKEIALRGLKDAHNRLSAWADNARLWAVRLPDLEAAPHVNLAKNYDYCLARIDAAIAAMTS